MDTISKKDNSTYDKEKHIKQLIEYDENNIDGKSDVEHDSIFFQTNENNNNQSDRKFEYSKNKCIADSEQFNSNGHSQMKTKIITAKKGAPENTFPTKIIKVTYGKINTSLKLVNGSTDRLNSTQS